MQKKNGRRNVNAIFPMADESGCRRAEVVDCRRDDSDRTPRGTKMAYHCACSTLVDHRIPDRPHSSLCRRGPSRVPEFLSCVFTCCWCRLIHADSPRVSVRVLIIRTRVPITDTSNQKQWVSLRLLLISPRSISLRWVGACVKSFFAFSFSFFFFREEFCDRRFCVLFFFYRRLFDSLNFFFRDKSDNQI